MASKFTTNIDSVKNYLQTFQSKASQSLRSHEESDYILTDSWLKSPNEKLNGEGTSIVIENGNIIDKGGINFSHVSGSSLPATASKERVEVANQPFQALGVSIVIHPKNPHVPTSHCNVRYFQTEVNDKTIWWFGGGYDLTPFYPKKEEVIAWHKKAYELCKPFGASIYDQFKKNCDDYFYLKHRQENRGVGGLFFDDLNQKSGWSFEQSLSFIEAVSEGFLESYSTILRNNINQPYTKQEKIFQRYRRGRYVEFNLLYDRGTIFGLQSGGRTESILMSLPNEVNWNYQYKAKENSPEEKLLSYLQPQDWLNLNN